MKRDFLKELDLGEGARLPDAAIEAIMTEHGKTTGSLQERLKALTQERDELKAQAEKHADYDDILGQRNALQRDIDIRDARAKVSANTGVPASLLTGDTEEACQAQAEALTKWRGTVPAYPDTHDGGEVSVPSGGSTAEQFERWFNDNRRGG